MKNQHKRGKRKANKKTTPRSVPKGQFVPPRTADEYFSKSEHFQDKWNRVTHVISKMRDDRVSLQQASREFALAPRTVIRWSGSALRKRTNGQYAAKVSDRLLRVLVIPQSEGLREIGVPDSRQASQVGAYWGAVQKYLETGDSSGLRKFKRKRITDANGTRIPLLTELSELDRLGSAGVLSFESLYAKAA
jgi:hypothetical protein